MREIFRLARRLDLRALFVAPTQNVPLQFLRYAFVGGAAALADAGVLWGLERMGPNYLVAAVFGFFAGLAVNFALSKALVFRYEAPRAGALGEFLGYGAIGGVGLLLTLGLMYFLTEFLGLHFMLSKAVSTAIVLLWNFAGRKYLLYSHRPGASPAGGAE
ncbi:MAG: GtrA family protein [Clostridiales bacterium]|jgi:putative flippase GtrA|nr:GtrA family protein [Clostridiales bacterium]